MIVAALSSRLFHVHFSELRFPSASTKPMAIWSSTERKGVKFVQIAVVSHRFEGGQPLDLSSFRPHAPPG